MSYLPRLNRVERPNYEPALPQEEFIVPLLRRHIEEAIIQYANSTALHGRALDVGCGRQPFRSALESMGYLYTGIDVQQNPEATVDVLCAIDNPLPPELINRGPFHFLLCTELMEHVADWDAAFKNLASLMAPSGRILITCPHFYQLHEEPYDFWRPTLHALNYFGWRVGLRTVHQKAAGDAWDILGTLLANCSASSGSNRFLDRGATKLVNLFRRGMFKMLCRRRIQQRVHLRGPLYLSNIVIFERT